MDRKCACKGIRTCLICEMQQPKRYTDEQEQRQTYLYCPHCSKAWLEKQVQWTHYGHSSDHFNTQPTGDLCRCGHSNRKCLDFPGINLILDFITDNEEEELVVQMEATPWVNSQSGRRKQDYGPKANFKKKKLKLGCFNGLPAFCKTLVERMQRTEQLRDFVPVELCDLEYVPDRGSAIDPHFDDFWLWGERLVTFNLLSDTYLTLSKDDQPGVEVLVPMPRKSLIIVSGPARFQWKHAIKRDHIQSRRIAMTFRELTPEFLEGGPQEDTGRKMIDLAKTFRGVAVGGQLSLIQS